MRRSSRTNTATRTSSKGSEAASPVNKKSPTSSKKGRSAGFARKIGKKFIHTVEAAFAISRPDLRKAPQSLYGEPTDDDAFANVELPRDEFFADDFEFAGNVHEVLKRCEVVDDVLTEAQISEVVLEVVGKDLAEQMKSFVRDCGLVSIPAQPAPPLSPRVPIVPFDEDSDKSTRDDDDFDQRAPSVVQMQYERYLLSKVNKFEPQRFARHSPAFEGRSADSLLFALDMTKPTPSTSLFDESEDEEAF